MSQNMMVSCRRSAGEMVGGARAEGAAEQGRVDAGPARMHRRKGWLRIVNRTWPSSNLRVHTPGTAAAEPFRTARRNCCPPAGSRCSWGTARRELPTTILRQPKQVKGQRGRSSTQCGVLSLFQRLATRNPEALLEATPQTVLPTLLVCVVELMSRPSFCTRTLLHLLAAELGTQRPTSAAQRFRPELEGQLRRR